MDPEALLRDVYVLADREVTHVYSFRDGLVVRMDVIEPQE